MNFVIMVALCLYEPNKVVGWRGYEIEVQHGGDRRDRRAALHGHTRITAFGARVIWRERSGEIPRARSRSRGKDQRALRR